MFGNSAVHPRLFVFVPICAAVTLFTVCSDAARASHTATQSRVTYDVPRQLYTLYSQHRPSSIGLLSTETGLHGGTNDETGTSWNHRGTPSIIDQQSKPFQFTQGIYSNSQNSPDNKRRIIKVQRGHRADGARPASSFFTSQSSPQHGGRSSGSWHSRQNNHALSQKETPTENSPDSHSVIIRKPSPEKAGSRQSSSFSHIWDQKYIPKPYSEGQVARSDSSKMDEDKSARKSFYFSLSPSQTGAYWETPRGHYSGYKEVNESPAVRAQSTWSGSQSSNFFSSGSHLAPRVTSISDSSNTPVIKTNPSVEKLTSSITDFTQGPDSESSSETQRHKKMQAYLLKGPQTSVNKVTGDGRELLSGLSSVATMSDKQRPSDAPASRRFGSNVYNVKDPTKQANADLPYHHISAAQYDGQMQKGLKSYQPISSLHLPHHITAPFPPQVTLHPAPVKSQNMESFPPAPYVNFRHGYATGSEKPLFVHKINTTTRDSVHNYKQRGPTQSTYGFREFQNPLWPDVKRSAVPTFKGQTSSKQYSFDNVKDNKFKVSSIYPALLPKYSFLQRGSSTTQTPTTPLTPPTSTPTTPVKLERTPTYYSSPAPSTLIQITTPILSVSRFKQVHPLTPKSDAGMDRNPDDRQVRTYKMLNDLKGSDPQPLEGAKPSVRGLDKSATLQQDGIKARSPQASQPRSFRIQNETESRFSNASTSGPNEPSSEARKPHLKPGDSESVTLDKNPSRRYTFRRFKSTKNTTVQARNNLQWQYPMQDPAAASYIVSSAYLRSPGRLRFASRLTSASGTPNKNSPAVVKPILHNTSTSRSVRAKRVRVKHKNSKKLSDSTFSNHTVAIVRLPKHPAAVKAVTYTDVLGNASFSGVKATRQAPDMPTDTVHYPNVTAMTGQLRMVNHWTLNSEGVHSGQNVNQSSEPNTEDGNISSAEKNKVSKSKEADNKLKTSGFLLHNEESGSGGSNLPEVLSSGTAGHAFRKHLLELEYLKISAGNLSFKSANLSHPNTKTIEMLEQFQ